MLTDMKVDNWRKLVFFSGLNRQNYHVVDMLRFRAMLPILSYFLLIKKKKPGHGDDSVGGSKLPKHLCAIFITEYEFLGGIFLNIHKFFKFQTESALLLTLLWYQSTLQHKSSFSAYRNNNYLD